MSQENNIGVAVIFSGPSGVGKSTVCRHLTSLLPGFHFSVSCTTRAPRPGEIDGREYHFLSREEFLARQAAGEFLEYAEVHGNCYGTLRQEVEPRVLAGEDVVLDIDVQGAQLARQALAGKPELAAALLLVFLAPPSMTELERRLRGRKTETEDAIQRRLANATREMAAWRKYDYVIVNDEAPAAAEKLAAIVRAAHCRCALMRKEPWNNV
ncbi:MAG TPA: guanylate kinase [Lentisphaeria bacterium]|nr:guanylate kinase [Lentisphaeria bacterium]HQC52215.1 guanylate kinase [Lentisphaeria bacterium]